MAKQTSRVLALSNVPFMEKRELNSHSITTLIAPRTFGELEEWPDFLSNTDALVERLDNCHASYFLSKDYFRGRNLLAPADEAEVCGYMGIVFYFGANVLAAELGIPFEFRGGGNDTGLSFADCVIVDTTQGSPTDCSPSTRVFGAGKIKGPWQFELDDGQSFIDAVRAEDEHAIQVLQELYGDLVMEEAYAGFLSNYNQTIFFKRSNRVKSNKLFVSPVIKYNECPIKAYIYFLNFVYENRWIKSTLPRSRVQVTPEARYILTLPPLQCFESTSQQLSTVSNPQIQVKAKGNKKRTREEEGTILVDTSKLEMDATSRIEDLPNFTFQALGLRSACLAEGRHVRVLEGCLETIPLVIKAFDPSKLPALESFNRERQAYKRLQLEQGISIPIVFFVGRLAHTGWPFLAMSREGVPLDKMQGEEITSRRICGLKKKVKSNLVRVHKLGVLHNDMRPSNILICCQDARIIDFGTSEACDKQSSFRSEILEVDTVFQELFHM